MNNIFSVNGFGPTFLQKKLYIFFDGNPFVKDNNSNVTKFINFLYQLSDNISEIKINNSYVLLIIFKKSSFKNQRIISLIRNYQQ